MIDHYIYCIKLNYLFVCFFNLIAWPIEIEKESKK